MGCCSSKALAESGEWGKKEEGNSRVEFRAWPKWKAQDPITQTQLEAMREEFWDTQPYYGGDRVIWDALKAACEADLDTARLIIDSAGIIVAAPDMTVCYDAKGAKYELPLYVLSGPTNLVKSRGSKARPRSEPQQQVQLTAGA